MEIIQGRLLTVRNYTKDDYETLSHFLLEENSSKEYEQSFLDLVNKSFEDDISSSGEKMLAIALNNEVIGRLSIIIDKPSIVVSHSLYGKYNSRIYIQDLVMSTVMVLHQMYPHREISTYASKFDYKLRAVLENFGFVLANIDKLTNIYRYTIFKSNPLKDK